MLCLRGQTRSIRSPASPSRKNDRPKSSPRQCAPGGPTIGGIAIQRGRVPDKSQRWMSSRSRRLYIGPPTRGSLPSAANILLYDDRPILGRRRSCWLVKKRKSFSSRKPYEFSAFSTTGWRFKSSRSGFRSAMSCELACVHVMANRKKLGGRAILAPMFTRTDSLSFTLTRVDPVRSARILRQMSQAGRVVLRAVTGPWCRCWRARRWLWVSRVCS